MDSLIEVKLSQFNTWSIMTEDPPLEIMLIFFCLALFLLSARKTLVTAFQRGLIGMLIAAPDDDRLKWLIQW